MQSNTSSTIPPVDIFLAIAFPGAASQAPSKNQLGGDQS